MARALEVGEAEDVSVEAKPFWNRTGVLLESGGRYAFSASGKWHDWWIETDADGYENFPHCLLRWIRRAPREPVFKLMGAVDADGREAFPIGSESEHSCPVTGELLCFANDIRGFYWNNCGSVTLSIRRVS